MFGKTCERIFAAVGTRACLASAVALFLFPAAAPAQTIEYNVTIIPRPDAAFSSVPFRVNNSGVVVGWAQFSGPDLFLAGWRWSEADGLELLPPPPDGMFNRYGARDINDSGVILGDGGGDSGLAWKLENGTYTVLGTLPFAPYDASVGNAINGLGDVVGGAFDSQHFTTPRRAFIYTDGKGLQELVPDLPSSSAGDINDAGQIVVSAGNGTFRLESDGTRTSLPIPAGFDGVAGSVINENGDVAGVVRCSHECNQAFLYTDGGGMEVIPSVGTRHFVAGVNGRGEVVGGVTEGVSRGWIWTRQDGIRFLTSLIDPGLTLLVIDAMGINEVGQIIAWGIDYSVGFDNTRVMLLTPVGGGGNGIPCADVQRMMARCRANGTLTVQVTFWDSSHDGEVITLGIEGDLVDVTIAGSRATYRQGGFTGPVTVTLDDPAGCLDPVEVSCP